MPQPTRYGWGPVPREQSAAMPTPEHLRGFARPFYEGQLLAENARTVQQSCGPCHRCPEEMRAGQRVARLTGGDWVHRLVRVTQSDRCR